MESEAEDFTDSAFGLLSDLPRTIGVNGFTESSCEASILAKRLSPAALAYLGDAVYEIYVRTLYLNPPKRIQDYHNQVVSHVRAESQARHLRSLQPYLTDVELEILRRGRNAAVRKLKRLDASIYQQASSLEALLGYLYLVDTERLFQLLAQLRHSLEEESSPADSTSSTDPSLERDSRGNSTSNL